MPWLRSMEILNDIHTVFTEEDFNLKSYEAQSENNLDKWQFCVNVNGTVTAVAQCYAHEACVLCLTFVGNGQVELWDERHSDHFLIDQDKYTPKEISEQFHEWIAKTYKDAFEDGGFQVLPFVYSGKLSTNKIIPQVYSVFGEMELISPVPYCIPKKVESQADSELELISPACLHYILNKVASPYAPPKYKKYIPPKFECLIDGKLMLEMWIDIWEDRTEIASTPLWRGSKIDLVFDGSNSVTIAKVGCNDGQRVPIQQVSKYILETYEPLGRILNHI